MTIEELRIVPALLRDAREYREAIIAVMEEWEDTESETNPFADE
jgi:hypothetical protein